MTVASLSVRISSSDEEIGGARAALLARVGRLDAIVDNASINGVWAPIDDLMPNEWDRIVRVNLRGTYLTLHVFVPLLKVAGGGAISSCPPFSGVRTFTSPGAIAYSATKGAQVAMAQQLALELGRHSIRSTFFVRARSLPKYQPRRISGTARMWRSPSCGRKVALLSRRRARKSADAAGAIHFLLTASARHITGSPLFVDGGQGLLR